MNKINSTYNYRSNDDFIYPINIIIYIVDNNVSDS